MSESTFDGVVKSGRSDPLHVSVGDEPDNLVRGLEGKFVDNVFHFTDIHFSLETLVSLFPNKNLTETTTSSPTGDSGTVITKPAPLLEDPSCPVKGIYRLLELVTERGKHDLGEIIASMQWFTQP